MTLDDVILYYTIRHDEILWNITTIEYAYTPKGPFFTIT